jgi:hypothetical protein
MNEELAFLGNQRSNSNSANMSRRIMICKQTGMYKKFTVWVREKIDKFHAVNSIKSGSCRGDSESTSISFQKSREKEKKEKLEKKKNIRIMHFGHVVHLINYDLIFNTNKTIKKSCLYDLRILIFKIPNWEPD